MKQYDDYVQLEKVRIQAIKEIAVEYYKNQLDIHIQKFIKYRRLLTAIHERASQIIGDSRFFILYFFVLLQFEII